MKTTQLDVDLTQFQPQERPRTCSPDPSWPIEKRLRWYQVYSHVLMLNVSERCRRQAFAAAEKELGREARREADAAPLPG